ncbi:hypothetical protein CHU95_08365 [Niveispirillum lacus]|uniref:Uncharacterized protein n=1 Tax=Niveispirillum lacus TaxID=1981099 RepID=A0A255Z2T7_9PROT|nr:hypothetical protein [Niveispirillum lacus]OYQ35234.1 hypothetical protein CHU95_08365 [Niveispirillum lacus]
MDRAMEATDMALGGWQVALLMHAFLTLAALWPARRLLQRAGLPVALMGWLVLPLFGWAVFASVLAFKPWPKLPPRPEKLHPRERLKRQRAQERSARNGEG